MNIQTNDEKNTIPVTEDDAFSYDGYQVVRGEFFAHTYDCLLYTSPSPRDTR